MAQSFHSNASNFQGPPCARCTRLRLSCSGYTSLPCQNCQVGGCVTCPNEDLIGRVAVEGSYYGYPHGHTAGPTGDGVLQLVGNPSLSDIGPSGFLPNPYIEAFPWPSATCDRRTAHIRALPEENVAEELLENYYTGFSSMALVVTRKEAKNLYLATIGMRGNPHSSPCEILDFDCRLATLWAIFAIGSQSRPSSLAWKDSTRYIRAAHDMYNTNETPLNLPAVQALILIFQWYRLAKIGSVDQVASILASALSTAKALNLHHDPETMNITGDEAIRRRRVFWELQHCAAEFSISSRHIMETNLGLPGHALTKHPFDTAEALDQPPAYFRWKHQFLETIYAPLVDLILKPLEVDKYQETCTMSRAIKIFAISASIQQLSNYGDIRATLEHYLAEYARDYCLVLLHRRWFILAIKETPNHPTTHAYGESVSVLTEATSSLIHRFEKIGAMQPWVLERHPMWTACLGNCLMALGRLLLSSPKCPIALSCLSQFETGMKLLEQKGPASPASQVSLQTLRTLKGLHNDVNRSFGAKDIVTIEVGTRSEPTADGEDPNTWPGSGTQWDDTYDWFTQDAITGF